MLVGHSVGGLFARLYASRYPDEVAGLVLVDTSPRRARGAAAGTGLGRAFRGRTAGAIQAGNTEGIDLEASFAQMRDARTATPLKPMPLIVLSAGLDDPAIFPAGWPMEAEAQLHHELQADLAGLVPGGRHVIAEQSGHYVQQSQPDLVVAAIREVVQAVIDPRLMGSPRGVAGERWQQETPVTRAHGGRCLVHGALVIEGFVSVLP